MVQETVENLLGELDTDYFESIEAEFETDSKAIIQVERFDASFTITVEDNTIIVDEESQGRSETYRDVTIDDVTNILYK